MFGCTGILEISLSRYDFRLLLSPDPILGSPLLIMPLKLLQKAFGVANRLVSPSIRWVKACALIFIFFITLVQAQNQSDSFDAETNCPKVADYISLAGALSDSGADTSEWSDLVDTLSLMMPSCLDSSEYFALLGGAQLNALDIANALELLERALLLDPDNGAALIDYAEALYLDGQLFAALEITERLLERSDLPKNIEDGLRIREKSWRSQATRFAMQVELFEGYDKNLNAAPDTNQITLTLSGQPISLALNSDFQSIAGSYSSLNVGAAYQVLGPSFQKNWSSGVRGRVSKDRQSDILQFDSRYSWLQSRRLSSWGFDMGLTHLMVGGNELFNSAQGALRYQWRQESACSPSLQVAAQRQWFSRQRILDAVESKFSAGLTCDSPFMEGSKFGVTMGLLHNNALRSSRPGGDREGWQLGLNWRASLFKGAVQAQVSRTNLNDRKGYSAILADGADRWVVRDQVLISYRQPILIGRTSAAFTINFFHQEQGSNIVLFGGRDTSLEVGLGFAF